jgi:RHS repeat-associated protein
MKINNQQSTFKFTVCFFTAIFLLAITNISFAQDDDEDDDSQETRVSNNFDFELLGGVTSRLQPLGNSLMGDNIDKNTGAISFEHLDISLPGNSNLEVAIRRKIVTGIKFYSASQEAFGNWVLDLPIAYVTYGYTASASHPSFNNGCMTNAGTALTKGHYASAGYATAWFQKDAHTEGRLLKVPGKGLSGFQNEAQLLTSGLSDPKNNWKSGGQSVDSNGRCAEIAIAPDVTKYKFGRHTFRRAKEMRVPAYWENNRGGNSLSGYSYPTLSRKFAVYMVTEVEDIHGNWVRYDYSSGSEPRLKKIESNDGRLITIQYQASDNVGNSRLISKITANGREWIYEYDNLSLEKVTLPDGRYWELGVGTGLDETRPMLAMNLEPTAYYKCEPSEGSFAIKHPDGAIGTFILREEAHRKATVSTDMGESHLNTGPGWIYGSTGSHNYAGAYETNSYLCRNGYYQVGQEPSPDAGAYRAMSLIEKKITGPDLIGSTWAFQYGGHPGTPMTKSYTKITQPDGTVKTYNFHTFGTDHGLLESIDTMGSDSTTETVTYIYDVTQPVDPNCAIRGEYGDVTGSCYNSVKRPIKKRTISRESVNYVMESEFDKTNGIFNDYGRPNKITRYSSLDVNNKRITELDYWHNTNDNVIGMMETIKRNGKEFAHYDYFTKGLLQKVYRFGVKWSEYTYNTAGNLYTIQDALNYTATLSNYKRGKPQSIVRRDGSTLSRLVDNNGWVLSETDGLGTTIEYTYNDVGWMTGVNRPSPWTDTTVIYHSKGTANFRSVELRGTNESTTWYDTMLRPTLSRTKPTSGGGTTTYQSFEYDAMGKKTFISFPTKLATPTRGTELFFDGLGRMIEERENISPFASTTTEYLAGNQRKVTDPNGNHTTTTLSGFGSPSDGEITLIKSPENVSTQMNYDIYGNMISMTQFDRVGSASSTQNWYYDSRLRVCRHQVPETGSKLFQYDNANQITAYVEGYNTSNNCPALPSANKVSITYDELGREEFINYPAGTGDIAKTYDDNGNLLTLNRAGVNWTYTYDNLNHLSSEKLDIDNRNYDITYTYNNERELLTRTLPSGKVLSYSHDGVNRTTSVANGPTSYASNIAYNAFGSIKRVTYGNGMDLSQSYTTQGQLRSKYVEDENSDMWMDHFYQYDPNGNITEIANDDERIMSYDGLNRLESADGAWGNGSYSYDSLGNLKSKTLGSRTVISQYDYVHNRILASADSQNGNRSFSYDSKGNTTTAGSLSFTYDAANQPISMSGSSSGVYVYDGNLKRVKLVVNGKTIYNVFDQSGKLVLVDEQTDNNTTEYIHAAGQTIARIKNNIITYLHADHLGTPILGTTASGGSSFSEKYTPFGEKYYQNSQNDNVGGYTGHIYDSATDLTYMQARYYDPVIGRFYSNDPVGYTAQNPVMSFNRYLYVNNNPYKYTDPDGEFLLGAAVGFALDLTVQLIENGGDISKVDPLQLAGATAMGAIGGGIGNQIAKASTAISTLTKSTKIGAVTNITGNTVAGVTTEGVKSAALITVDSVAGTDYAGDTSSKVVDSIGSNAQTSTVNNVISGATNNSKLGQIAEIGVKAYSEISQALEDKQ